MTRTRQSWWLRGIGARKAAENSTLREVGNASQLQQALVDSKLGNVSEIVITGPIQAAINLDAYGQSLKIRGVGAGRLSLPPGDPGPLITISDSPSVPRSNVDDYISIKIEDLQLVCDGKCISLELEDDLDLEYPDIYLSRLRCKQHTFDAADENISGVAYRLWMHDVIAPRVNVETAFLKCDGGEFTYFDWDMVDGITLVSACRYSDNYVGNTVTFSGNAYVTAHGNIGGGVGNIDFSAVTGTYSQSDNIGLTLVP